MTLSIWRYAHLILAITSFIFLSMASITGSILAFNTIKENTSPNRIHNLKDISLAQVLPVLQNKYLEITELEITENSYIKLQGLDEEGNDVEGYINPLDGKIIGKTEKKSDFIQWVTSFHRSLFLHETGRWIIGINSFLLALIAVSGSILIIKRQKKLSRFFSKIKKSSFSQYYHAVFGRLLLIPIIIISVTGTYLSMERFNFFPKTENKKIQNPTAENEETVKINSKDIPLFKQIKLAEVQKIEFPFSEEPDDFYIIKLKDKEIEVNQFNGSIISQTDYPLTKRWTELSLDLHTGRTHIVWAAVLMISSLYILFFIYSGFTIMWKRRVPKFKNKFSAKESKIILLVGSENGSTFWFAHQVHKQLLAQNQHSYLAELNRYQEFPKAEYLVIFTSTYGLGDAPSNASKFELLLKKHPQNHPLKYCVVGFGSKAYKDYCGFAQVVNTNIRAESWGEPFMKIHTVNDKSPEEFTAWVKEWNKQTLMKLYADSKFYKKVPQGLKKMKVDEIFSPEDSENTFMLRINPGNLKYTSGDLLVVYPDNDEKERYYSIARVDNRIQLSIKYLPGGLASEFLIKRKVGDELNARVMPNTSFHFPDKASKVVLIANGTGIAPFLGMVQQNTHKTETFLYCGFRRETEITSRYKIFLDEQVKNQQLVDYTFCYSRSQEHRYVMDLVRRDTEFFADLLENDGILMICGALQMQAEVEAVLEEIVFEKYAKRIIDYKNKGQILSDCY
ncbi:PepSY domain-containing protein [Apibacter raozihei]|uniref:PepSY domain-containing protein n=1 Tax=Apibacter raozihei TaxID=2500547 RepID=UPI000FE3A540|nr:PepSY domain-containing protein [Apibacter raozihei]